MRKIVPIALASAVMTACVGPVEDTGSSSAGNISSATQQMSSSQTTVSSTPQVSSSSVAPASSSQATTSSAAGGDRYSDYIPNALNGSDLYLNKGYDLGSFSATCALCHGDDGQGTTKIDVNKFVSSPQSLFELIRDEMAPDAEGQCVGQCAADITAFILSWAGGTTDPEKVSCDTTKPINYSPRALKLLTVDEYQNTIEDLLGFDEDIRDRLVFDSERGGFPNNIATNIDLGRADKYWELADYVATWVMDSGNPFDCSAGCAGEFIDSLLPRLFRRPITQAERAQYEELFATGDAKIAFVAALTSPQFLYRSELGQKVSDVLSTEPESYYRPDPDTQVVVTHGTGDGFLDIGYYTGVETNYSWTGNDIVSFQVKASMQNGNFPTLSMRINNVEYKYTPTSDRAQTVRFQVEGATPSTDTKLNMNAQPNTFIGPVTLGGSVLYTPSRGDEEKMRLADADAYVLDPFEYASLLSYTLTGSAPDTELWNAAMNDGLHYEDQIRAQVERLIDSPRGKAHMGEMASHWFDTYKITGSLWDRDMAIFPNYTPAVRSAMAEEVRQLFREVFYNERPFESFYGGDFTVVNKALSDYYGISSGASSNSDWRVVEGLDKRGGMLTSGAFMTLHALPEKTRPITRAVRVREDMLCQHILPPPILISDREALTKRANDEYHAGMTTIREYNETITDAESCYGCHQYKINPLFGMEDFDQTGRWRETEQSYGGLNTLTVNTAGKLYGPIDINDETEGSAISFNGAKELSKVVAGLPGVEECLIEKGFRFVAGLPITDKGVDSVASEPKLTSEQKVDYACAADDAKAAYASSGRSARAVITELVMQDLLRYRK